MKSESFKGTVENAYGEKLSTPVDFTGTFDAYETFAELEAAKDIPSNDEIVSFVNAKRKANARQKSMTEALEAKGISKPDPNDPVVVKATMLRNIDKLDIPADQKETMKALLQAK